MSKESRESVTPPEREHLTTDSGAPVAKKPRWGRRLLVAALVLLVVLGGLVVFAPQIATPFVKSALAGPHDNGMTIDVATLKLSWTGDQRAEGVVVTDGDGDVIADVNASIDRSLLDLFGDRTDLGTVTLSGKARVKQPPEEEPPASSEGSGSAEVSVQQDVSALAAALKLDGLELTLDQPDGDPIIADLSGTAALARGLKVTAEMRADVSRSGASLPAQLSVTGMTLDFARPIPIASLAATARTENASVALIDALANQGGRLEALLGASADLDLAINHAADGPTTADVALSATDGSARANLVFADGVLTSTGPIVAELDARGAMSLPEVSRPLADAGFTVDAAPRVTVELAELRLPLPTESGLPASFDPLALDLSGAAAIVTVSLTETRMSVPGQYFGTDDPATSVRTDPGTFTLDATDPAGAVTLRGSLNANVAGAPAGSLAVDLRASELLDTSGRLRTSALPRLAGRLTATDVPTALAQPFAAGSGLDLPADLGPTVRVSLVADAPASDEPARLTLTASSDRMTASGTAVLAGDILTTEGPIRIELLDPAPAIARLLGESPATLARTGPLDITISDVSIDTAAALGDPPNLATATARGVVRVGPIEGSLDREGADPVAFSAPRAAYTARLADEAITLETSYPALRVGAGETVGTTDVALTLAEPLTARRLTGVVSMSRVDGPAIASLFADERAASLARDMGPMFSVTLRPDLAPGEPTAAELDLVGSQVDLTARASLSASGLDAVARVHRLGTSGLDALTGRPGLAAAAMGPAASGFVSITAGKSAEGAIGAPFDASVELASEKLRTTAPARVRVTTAAAELLEEARLDWSVEPELFALLAGDDGTKLARATPLRVTIARAFVPLSENAGAPLAARASLTTDAFALVAPDGSEQRFTALAANVRTTDVPNQLALDASLKAPNATGETLSARLTVDDLVASNGAPANPAITGAVTADALPTALVDAFAGSGGTATRMLGATTNLRVDLNAVPREASTLAMTLAAPNATASYRGAVREGALVNTEPANINLNLINQEFGLELANFIPIIGGITKTASDQPASLDLPSITIPISGGLKNIAFDLVADPGTASIQMERGIAGLIDPRIVQQGRRLGDSFEPFNVSMKDGVARVTNFSLPIGEFSIPADATFDLNNSTEDVVVRLPAGMLLAESLGGDLGPLRNILGSALNPPLRKRGPIGADNKWKIDPSWKAPEEERKDPAEEIIRGLGGLLRDQLNKDKDGDG
ncbi:MAG: hypothetical protein RIB60_07380 [Phycisphaerales bacterium]